MKIIGINHGFIAINRYIRQQGVSMQLIDILCRECFWNTKTSLPHTVARRFTGYKAMLFFP